MKGLNKVTLIGRVGNEVECKLTKWGNETKISIATPDGYKDKQTGQWKDATEWHMVVFYGDTANYVAKSFYKGAKVWVEGKVKTKKVEENGLAKYITKIVGQEYGLIDKRQGAEPNGNVVPNAAPMSESGFLDDDIPF